MKSSFITAENTQLYKGSFQNKLARKCCAWRQSAIRLTAGLRDCCDFLVESPDFQKARANRFAFFCKLAKTSALAYFCARLRVLRHKSATNANRRNVGVKPAKLTETLEPYKCLRSPGF